MRLAMELCLSCTYQNMHRQTSNISCTLVGNKIVDHSDIVGAAPTSNYIFILDLTPGFNILGGDNRKTRREAFEFWVLLSPISEILRYSFVLCFVFCVGYISCLWLPVIYIPIRLFHWHWDRMVKFGQSLELVMSIKLCQNLKNKVVCKSAA